MFPYYLFMPIRFVFVLFAEKTMDLMKYDIYIVLILYEEVRTVVS